MPTVKDVLEQAKFLMGKGRADEPAKLVLPRIEAQRRVANREKRTRVQFDADETTYSLFHAQLKRYRELCGNVTVAHTVMIQILAAVPDGTISALAADEPADETLADA